MFSFKARLVEGGQRMLYETDFSSYLRSRNRFLSNQGARETPVLSVLKDTSELTVAKKHVVDKRQILKGLVKEYCSNTGIHGIRYIMQTDFDWFKRSIWMLMISLAFLGIACVSANLKSLFESTPTATVVESTIYSVTNIPYPAVTICNNNRINWDREEAVTDKYLRNASGKTREQFHTFLFALNTLEYGAFKDFNGIDGWNVPEMEHINLLELYQELSYTCEEFFEGAACWWRNKFVNCCEIFETQRTEYGLCYSFNHVLNEVGYERVVRTD